jgi:biotin transport system substrate-specific component
MNVREMTLAALFAALLAVSSQFSITLGAVPHTLQVFVVILAGLVLGARLGAISVALWITIGCFGLPVFSQGKAGAAVLLGPTGGFLIGFVVCAYLVGRYAQGREITSFGSAIAILTGVGAVYILGWAGFMASFEFFLHKPMTWEKAASLVIVPFLPFDLIKAVMASYLGMRVRQSLLKAGLTVANK